MLETLKGWARRIKRDVAALWRAARDRRTPFAAKAVAAAVVAYALSPIDLIPDFIPVLGLLDDAILLPFGILLAVRLIPPALMAEFRAAADLKPPASRAGAALIVALWAVRALATVLVIRYWSGP